MEYAMENKTDKTTKTVELVVSERGDIWMEDLEVLPEESLRDALKRRGYESFQYIGVVMDDPGAIKDKMVVRIRLMP
jgi:hypothetical protein